MKRKTKKFKMKFVKVVREKLKIPNGAQFAKLLGIHPEYIYRYENRAGSNKIQIPHLCKMRKESKMSWAKFGKMLDEEFLTEESKDG